MHIVYTTNSLLGLHSFSSVVSWAILVGAFYGCVRLLVDLWHSFTRSNVTLTRTDRSERRDSH